MTDPTGALRLTANGEEYQLHMGTSVLAALQGIHGQDVLSRVDPPEGATDGWMPDLMIVHDLFRLSLERHHGKVDRYIVDDIIAQNGSAFRQLMTASSPDPAKAKPGNGAAPRARKPSTSGR